MSVRAPTAAPAPKSWIADFIVLASLWGGSFLFMRIATLEFGPLPTAAVRVSIAMLFLLPLVWLRGLMPVLRANWQRVFFVGLFNSAIPFACFAFALLAITSGLSAILNATVPMFGALIAWAWLKDRPSASRVLGLVIGFAGVAMLAWDQASFKPGASGIAPAWAALACLLGCVCYGVAASYTKRHLAGLPPLVTAAGSQVGASLGLTLPALWFWPARMPGVPAWLALLVTGVACTGLAYIIFFRLIENAGPPRALAVTFLVPVFAVLYGALFLGESATPWMAVCAGVIVCGTALATGLVTPRPLRRKTSGGA